MGTRNAIGIDPDSKGFVCALVKTGDAKIATKGYSVSDAELESFIRWVRSEGDVIIAVEGLNGLSRPIETALRDAGMVFYSFKPSDTETFRKAVLGQNKNNEKDAESVARYAMALESQGRLDRYRRVWFADQDLQLLSRSYGSNAQRLTASTSSLWKLLRQACPDLYLLFKGSYPEVEMTAHVLTAQGVLTLLRVKPNPGEWKRMTEDQMLAAMGGERYPGRRALVNKILRVAGTLTAISPILAMLIRTEAERIARLKHEQNEFKTMLAELLEERPAARSLLAIRGIGTVTAAALIAEIIDVRRFAREDRLASYSGLGMKEYATGETAHMLSTRTFNHRLKDAFMTAAGTFVQFNKDSHLSGYYRNLVKKGMKPMEARKRVARALVRVIYRQLTSLIESEGDTPNGKEMKEGEGAMASGQRRGVQGRLSNMAPSTPDHDITDGDNETAETSPSRERSRRTKKRRSVKKSA